MAWHVRVQSDPDPWWFPRYTANLQVRMPARFGMVGADHSCGVCLGDLMVTYAGTNTRARDALQNSGARCGGGFTLLMMASTNELGAGSQELWMEWLISNRGVIMPNFRSYSFFAI